jgi:hypothetical protein
MGSGSIAGTIAFRAAVLTDVIASTGHNCDSGREPPELSVVRFGK